MVAAKFTDSEIGTASPNPGARYQPPAAPAITHILLERIFLQQVVSQIIRQCAFRLLQKTPVFAQSALRCALRA